MTAYVAFVTDAAEGNAHVFSLHSSCYRRAERGLSYSGRSYKAEYLVLQLGIQLLYREVFENALFYLSKSVVIRVEYLLCGFNVNSVVSFLVPRNVKAGLDVVAYYGSFG